MTADLPDVVRCVCGARPNNPGWNRPGWRETECFRCPACGAGGHISASGARHGPLFGERQKVPA